MNRKKRKNPQNLKSKTKIILIHMEIMKERKTIIFILTEIKIIFKKTNK
jgi:hypothetical protein